MKRLAISIKHREEETVIPWPLLPRVLLLEDEYDYPAEHCFLQLASLAQAKQLAEELLRAIRTLEVI